MAEIPKSNPKKPGGRPPPGARGPVPFKERDLARALRAAKRTGGVSRVEIARNGHIQIILSEQQAAPPDTTNPWDDLNAAD
jgi:hypothetical protein